MIEVILSVGLAFLATVIAEPHFIQYMKMKQLGQTTLDEGPSWHKAKSGTPTMGGLVFLCMISISSLIVGAVFGHFNFVLLSGVIGFAFFGTIGFLDDFIKVFKKQNEGLKSHEKFGLQLIGSAIFVGLYLLSGNAPLIYIPFFGEVNSIIIFALFTIIWITGFSNAVNLTDGLDGLAASTNTIAYGIYMAFIFFLLLYYHKRIPTSLFHMLVIVQFICVFLVCAENYFGSNTFLAITFLLPIMVILYMVHGSSYSIKTGALNADSLNEYLNQQASIQISTYYMCLRFDTDSEYVMPDELGKLFFNFWNGYFKNGLLFHPSTDFFVLAIDVSDIRNADKIAQDMIQNDFKRHFETYKLPYKIVMFNHLDFCENLEQFYELFNFFAEPMELNNFRSCDTADYKSFHDMKYLLAQLKDIAENGFLDDKRVLVYCQPIRNVNAGNYDTAEALMRLNLKDTGMVYPNRFIPLAEKNGYIHKLSMIILNKTCRAIREFQDEGYQLSRVSVNFSISELSNKNFMEEFRQIVERNGVDFHTIAVELTESRNDTEYELVLDRVMQFKSLGVCTYLDDFGTGYSNFDRILSLKLDVVKFDRSLLLMANKDENSQFILNYFSTAFEKLGYKVLYEGVETDEQETICVNSHADYLQGFKFSKPIPIEELKNFLSPIQE